MRPIHSNPFGISTHLAFIASAEHQSACILDHKSVPQSVNIVTLNVVLGVLLVKVVMFFFSLIFQHIRNGNNTICDQEILTSHKKSLPRPPCTLQKCSVFLTFSLLPICGLRTPMHIMIRAGRVDLLDAFQMSLGPTIYPWICQARTRVRRELYNSNNHNNHHINKVTYLSFG